MSRQNFSWRQVVAVCAIGLVGACSETPHHAVASNPPPIAPGPNAVWHTVYFETDSYALNADDRQVINDVVTYLRRNPSAVATVIGRTDSVGSKDFNMHLSHRRADVVRDAIVYDGNVGQDRVETRWTGEKRANAQTGNAVAAAENRVVDIAIH